jgi:hypothetical protein
MDCNKLFSDIIEQNVMQGIFLLALKRALLDKGLITEIEWKDYLIQGAEESEKIISEEIKKCNQTLVDKGLNIDDYIKF